MVLSTPSLGITRTLETILSVVLDVAFNSLSRDHGITERKEVMDLWNSITFNSLSRDHIE